MLVLGLTVSTLGTTMLTQYAEAERNCTSDSDGSFTCSGGESFKDQGIAQSGGFGGHREYDASTNTFSDSGGSGRNSDQQNGGIGGRVSCEPNVTCNSDSHVGSTGQGLHNK